MIQKMYKNMFLYEKTKISQENYQFFDVLKIKDRKI